MNTLNNQRLLMIAPTPFFSDRGCHIRILNSYLKKEREGYQIDLITYPLGRDVLDIKTVRTMKIWGYKKISPGFSYFKPFLDFLIYLKAKRLLKKNNYIGIYAHLHEGALIALLLKRFGVFHIVFDAQGSLVGELLAHKNIKEGSFFYKLLWKIERFVSNNVDEIITSTDGLKEFMLSNFSNKNIIVQKDYPDIELFNKDILPTSLDLPINKHIVVYLGGLQLYKGVDILIRSIPLTKDNIHFLIMGYPIEEAYNLALKMNIKDRITFTGRIPYEKAASFLRLGDVAVSPKTLGSGEANAKIYNYISIGLPVICFDLEENHSIHDEYPESKFIYVKECKERDFADAIQHFCDKLVKHDKK